MLVNQLSDVQTDCGAFIGESNNINPQSSEFKDISWNKIGLQIQSSEVDFIGNDSMPVEVSSLRTPYDFFSYFVPDTFLSEVANQSNLYARQRNSKTEFSVNVLDLKKYIGILFFMSVYRYPNVRSYWSRYVFQPIHSSMTVNRFEEIRRYMHFSDNQQLPPSDSPDYDVLYKIRPVVNHFNARFSAIPMLQRLCVDEQMCATKMTGSKIRQFMPNKPHKWGFKLFVLCDSSGFSYGFEIYSGKTRCQLNMIYF